MAVKTGEDDNGKIHLAKWDIRQELKTQICSEYVLITFFQFQLVPTQFQFKTRFFKEND